VKGFAAAVRTDNGHDEASYLEDSVPEEVVTLISEAQMEREHEMRLSTITDAERIRGRRFAWLSDDTIVTTADLMRLDSMTPTQLKTLISREILLRLTRRDITED
jgi:hypothetical protein